MAIFDKIFELKLWLSKVEIIKSCLDTMHEYVQL